LVILSVFDVQSCSSGDDDGDRGGDDDGDRGGDDDGDRGGDDDGDRLRLQMLAGFQLLDLTQTVILLPQLMQC
jgi:hypothetical protein